jgi:excisionase family DNA binding protein
MTDDSTNAPVVSLTIAQVAAALNVPAKTIRAKVEHGEIASVKVFGTHRRITETPEAILARAIDRRGPVAS